MAHQAHSLLLQTNIQGVNVIELIQGTPGSGKSAIALVMGLSHLCSGGAFAANFDLVEDWAFLLSGLNFRVRLGLSDRIERANTLRKRCFRIGTADTIFDLSTRLSTCGLSPEYAAKREGKGLLILDEAQLIFNSRQWSSNRQWIEFFTQHRKLGWNIILIAHHIQMIDKQVRPLVEIESRFRNLKNIHLPIIPIPLSPVNAFLVVRFYAGHGPGAGMVHNRNLFFLDKRLAQLYDTLRVFAFDDAQQSVTLQGVDPRVSAARMPDYSPDFFCGQRGALLYRRLFPKAKKKSRVSASRKKPTPLLPGQSVTHYGPTEDSAR